MREVNRAIVPNFNCLFVGVSERVMRTEESGSCGTLFRGGRYGEVRV